jgi:hypothetical protein
MIRADLRYKMIQVNSKMRCWLDLVRFPMFLFVNYICTTIHPGLTKFDKLWDQVHHLIGQTLP